MARVPTRGAPARERRAAPTQLHPADPHIADVLDLVKRTFAYMEDRIDPPSSMYRMSQQSIIDHCTQGEVWTLGTPVKACIFLTPKPDCLYVGKLAVTEDARGHGYARQLIELAEDRARTRGLPRLELETRIELHENHATFARLGFVKTGEDAHEGFSRPTFIIMQKPL